ncbi:Penicillin-binding protein 5 precursor (D-ala-D-ala-carboxypeptidase) [gamma proteobacterium HdN1]|nr:Penicillin-binding protein 5 precursor (D-ala-D-ala-carboxypeptidase) [gamma proteobacterium HdN1]
MIGFIANTLFIGALTASNASFAAETELPTPPQLAASSWILIEPSSGQVLVEHNADEQLPPASLTKMMTSYVAADKIKEGLAGWDDEVLVSEKAWRMGGSKMFIRVGTQVKIRDLMRGIIIQSGNDASVALAEHIAGSEESFADLMNQTAKRIGMTHTHYVNATGLPDPSHYTTARDLAILAQHVIFDHPEDYELYSEKEFLYNNIKQPNRNLLLWRDNSVDGIKTGHTKEAGYCLVASAKRDGMRLVAVVMNTNSEKARASETMKLLTYGFRFYENVRSYSAGEVLAAPEIWFGSTPTVKLGLDKDLVLTIPRGTQQDVKAELDYKPLELKAPIAKGQQLGVIRVRVKDKVISETPLVALEPVEEAGFIKKLWHHLLLFVKGLFS